MNCIFCQILSGDIPAHRIYEDDHALAFLDIQPLADGHVVVIPKSHAARITDLRATETGALFQAVHAVVSKMEDTLDMDGCTVGINDGTAAGQAIAHLHVHLVPRKAGDGQGNIHSIFTQKGERDITEIAALFGST